MSFLLSGGEIVKMEESNKNESFLFICFIYLFIYLFIFFRLFYFLFFSNLKMFLVVVDTGMTLHTFQT